MFRTAAGVALVVHGAIHLIGFAVPFQLAAVEGFQYRTTVLGGLIDLGPAGIRAIGAAWLLLAAGFVLAGFAVWRHEHSASRLTVAVAIGSLAVCVLGLPEAAAGIVVNAAILATAGFVALSGSVPVAGTERCSSRSFSAPKINH